MAHKKNAQLVWTGDDWNFETTLGSGYQVQFKAPEPDATGGSPMEFLLAGVAGCTGVDVLSILKKMRMVWKGFTLEVSGELTEGHPKVYSDIHIAYRFTGPELDRKKIERAVELSQTAYCGVTAMLGKTAKITTSIELTEA